MACFEFDNVVSIITTSRTVFYLQDITTALMDAEARQQAHISNVTFPVNLTVNNKYASVNVPSYISQPPSQMHPAHAGRLSNFRGRGHENFFGAARP